MDWAISSAPFGGKARGHEAWCPGYGERGEKDRADFGYPRLAARGNSGSPARVGADHSRGGRGEAGDFGSVEKDCAGCSGARKRGYGAVGAGLAGDGRGGGRRGHDLRPARCEGPGFESCRFRFSDRRQRPFPQTGKDGTRWGAVHQPRKRRTTEISAAGHGGTPPIRRDALQGGIRGSRGIPVTQMGPKTSIPTESLREVPRNGPRESRLCRELDVVEIGFR